MSTFLLQNFISNDRRPETHTSGAPPTGNGYHWFFRQEKSLHGNRKICIMTCIHKMLSAKIHWEMSVSFGQRSSNM